MKTLILSLAVLTFVSGAFGAERVHTPSPTNSVKAKKLLEGPEAAKALAIQQQEAADALKIKQKAPKGTKQSELMGAEDDASAKVKALANFARKDAALKSERDQAEQAAKAAHDEFVAAAKKNKGDKEWIKGVEAEGLRSDLVSKNAVFAILDKNYREFQLNDPLLAAAA